MIRKNNKIKFSTTKITFFIGVLLLVTAIVMVVSNIKRAEDVHFLRQWSIYTSQSINPDKLKDFGINVYDDKGKLVNTKITLGDFGKSILILPPDSGYIQGKTYILKIEKSFDCTIEKYSKNIKSVKFNIVIEPKDETTVNFRDKSFEAAVRALVKKSTGPISVKDVRNITYFVSTFGNIKDISGIEYFTNLRTLSLDGNKIEDISPLKKLTDLSSLGISHNNIKDFSSLKNLKNLKMLFVENNKSNDYISLKSIYKNLEGKDFTIN